MIKFIWVIKIVKIIGSKFSELISRMIGFIQNRNIHLLF